jgi:hypothetical protein
MLAETGSVPRYRFEILTAVRRYQWIGLCGAILGAAISTPCADGCEWEVTPPQLGASHSLDPMVADASNSPFPFASTIPDRQTL